MKQTLVLIILVLLLSTILVSCNDFALDLAQKEISGTWVNEYTQGTTTGLLTLEFLPNNEFTWVDRQGEVELENRKGSFSVYTNGKFSEKTKRATLVLKFEVAESEEENFETFFFFFTNKEGKLFLNLQSLTKEGYTYSFLKN